MDRRDFLKMSSMTALLTAGKWTGLSKVFAHDSLPLKQESFNSGNTSSNMEYRELGGLDVSAIGLGCLPMVGYYGGKYEKKDMITLISRAYDKGVTFFDTASVSGNEQAVGAAIRKSNIPRNELFITTKAWISEMGYDRTLQAFEASLTRLGLDYLDFYLIHMPFGDYYGAWRAMEELYAAGRVRAIGVCNFEPDRLMDLCHNVKIIPAVNQLETHPYTQQSESMRIMQSLGIQIEAWGPLAEGRNGLFANSALSAIGHKYGKSAAQVVLRWHLQRGVIAIPKSVHKERMEENFTIGDFSLSDEDMDILAAMDTRSSTILDLHSLEEVERLYNI